MFKALLTSSTFDLRVTIEEFSAVKQHLRQAVAEVTMAKGILIVRSIPLTTQHQGHTSRPGDTVGVE